MNTLIIDGQGGRLGAQLVKAITEKYPDIELCAAGTNSAATLAMIHAGAQQAATGENAVIVACRHADVIIGPIGIAITDALLGEVTPAMAAAVGQADAVRIFLPVTRCDNIVAGVPQNMSINDMVADVLVRLGTLRA